MKNKRREKIRREEVWDEKGHQGNRMKKRVTEERGTQVATMSVKGQKKKVERGRK